MPNPTDLPSQNTEYYKALLPLGGAFLSILGGFAAVFIRARLERKQETDYIRISIVDELQAICSIIEKLSETHNKAHTLSNDYLNDLSDNMESFTFHKQRLFRINSASLRRDIVSFYKELGENIKESINKVGTLGENPTNASHDPIITKFSNLCTKGHTLETRLSKYKYRLLWFNTNK